MITLSQIKQKFLEFVCKLFGHNYDPNPNNEDTPLCALPITNYNCTRCGKNSFVLSGQITQKELNDFLDKFLDKTKNYRETQHCFNCGNLKYRKEIGFGATEDVPYCLFSEKNRPEINRTCDDWSKIK